MIRVLVVDDHPVVRAGVVKIIHETHDIRVIAEAVSADETLRLLSSARIDVVLLDLNMPGSDGLNLLQAIKRSYPKVAVLILTIHSEDELAVRTLQAGAAGFLSKDMSATELITAVRRVAAGKRFVSEALAEQLAEGAASGASVPHHRLSNREYQVFIRAAKGQTIGEIANELSLSVKTVAAHRARVFEKMHLKTAAELAGYAVRKGLIE